MQKVLIMDTSILCVWLQVPGMETTGKQQEHTYASVSERIDREQRNGTKLVLPIATIIETGNHIAHAKGNKASAVRQLCDIIISVSKGESPWMIIDMQHSLWQEEKLLELVEAWQHSVMIECQSIGDAAIVQVAQQYAANFEVEIYTGDGGLKNYEYKLQGQQLRLRRNRK
jgi:hypothetical protein